MKRSGIKKRGIKKRGKRREGKEERDKKERDKKRGKRREGKEERVCVCDRQYRHFLTSRQFCIHIVLNGKIIKISTPTT